MINDIDDLNLIKGILDNDISSYSRLINKYQKHIFNLAFKFVNNRELAEEITQDVFVKIFRNIRSYKSQSKFTTWMYQIVFNTCISEKRKKSTLKIVDDFEEGYENIPSDEDWNIYEGDNNVLKSEIGKIINQLSEIDKLIISLYYLQEQSIDEICSILNLDRNTIKVKLFRARKKIRNNLTSTIKTFI